jgi:hypothetical protein
MSVSHQSSRDMLAVCAGNAPVRSAWFGRSSARRITIFASGRGSKGMPPMMGHSYRSVRLAWKRCPTIRPSGRATAMGRATRRSFSPATSSSRVSPAASSRARAMAFVARSAYRQSASASRCAPDAPGEPWSRPIARCDGHCAGLRLADLAHMSRSSLTGHSPTAWRNQRPIEPLAQVRSS